MTYQEHVREVAEEMASVNNPYAYSQYKKKGKIKSYYEKWGYCIQDELLSAGIAVRLEAEATKKALETFGFITPESIETYLIERGLIPEPEVKTFYCWGDEIRKMGPCTDQCDICAKKQTDNHDTSNQ